MPPAAHLGVDRGQILGAWRRAGRLAHRLGESDQIVDAVRGRVELAVVPDQFPAARRRQATRVLLTQVIRVWLGEGRERADHGGGFSIDIGQRRDR